MIASNRAAVRVRDLTVHSLSEHRPVWSDLSDDVTVSAAEQGSFGRVSFPKEEEGVAGLPVQCYLLLLLFLLPYFFVLPQDDKRWLHYGVKRRGD